MKKDFVFTSESVTEGHPDKLCDQISDAIVDRLLQHDPCARVSAECASANGVVFLAARFAAEVAIDFAGVARQTIGMAGYTGGPFDSRTCSIVTTLTELAPFRGRFCLTGLSERELDAVTVREQVTVFGFACRQSPALMPLPIWLAHRLARRLASVRLQKLLPYLAPDGKAQVAVEYRDGIPVRIHSVTVIASQQRRDEPGVERLRDEIRQAVVDLAFLDEQLKPDRETGIFINPEGSFVTGGPTAHAGLTGRKQSIDLYGEYARQSGAALSGKDPLRIDRSGVYAARYAAKNVVAAGLADECEVQLSYCIGHSRPVSVMVQTFGTGRVSDTQIALLLERHFEFRPAGIVQQFGLARLPATIKGGFYRKLAAYGQVGRMDIGLPWELTDRVEALREGR